MQAAKDGTINIAEFTPKGGLGELFARAKMHNQINAQLSKILPEELSALELCLIKQHEVTLIANNQALAFRAQKQQAVLLKTLTSLEALEHITKINIKLGLKED